MTEVEKCSENVWEILQEKGYNVLYKPVYKLLKMSSWNRSSEQNEPVWSKIIIDL